MAREREGRGWLSAIDLLPEDFHDIVIWADRELDLGNQLQIDIHDEFNRRLRARAEEIGAEVPTISKAAFNRRSMKRAKTARRMETAHAVAAPMLERLEPGDTDTLTILLGEMIKTLAFEIIESEGAAGMSPKETMQLAAAIKSASQAQSVSSARKRKLDEDISKKVDAVVEKAGEKLGLSKERVQQIRREVLGVKG